MSSVTKTQVGVSHAMLRIGVLCAILLFGLLYGCKEPELPTIVKVRDVQLEGLTNFNVVLQVENPNGKKIVISAAHAEVWLDESPLGTVRLLTPIILPKKQEAEVALQLALQFHSASDQLRLVFALATWNNAHTLELAIDVKGRYGIFPFRKKIARTSYSALQTSLGLPAFP